MAFLDWIKGPEHAYQANHGIKTVWKSSAYTDRTSGYTVQACLGMSEKGYHAGLAFTPKEGEARTTWHRPLQRRDHAMQECYSSLNKWVERHEAHVNDNPQQKMKRRGPSWDR
jgi:hypothetical protein